MPSQTPSPMSQPSRPAERLRRAVARSAVRVALLAQRSPWRPPEPVRRALARRTQRAVSHLAAAEPALVAWDEPLTPAAAPPRPVATGDAAPTASPSTAAPSARVARAEHPDALRCALVTSHLDVGGMDEMVAFLARRLPEHGVAVRVLHCPDELTRHVGVRTRLARELVAEGVQVFTLDAPALDRWLDQWRPDVVSAHGAPDWVLRSAAARDVPVVETLHGMHSLLGEEPAATAARGRLLAAVVGVSELVSEGYLRADPAFDRAQVHTVPNGVRIDTADVVPRAVARAALGLDDQPLAVSLARHCQQKNSYALVDTFDEVAALVPGAHLVVAGRSDDPSYTAQLLALRERLPARDRIHLRDHCPHPALLLAAADLFVLDSFFEGWSLASMEALTAGTPVVLSDVGGAREQVGEDGRRGTVVANPLGDPTSVSWEAMGSAKFIRQRNRNELVQALHGMLVDRDEWRSRAPELRQEARSLFDADRCVAAHARVLQSVVRPMAPSLHRRTG
ncbi:MAG: glycosyltransferase family 4 protein [Motilibacteraceae bacterium]